MKRLSVESTGDRLIWLLGFPIYLAAVGLWLGTMGAQASASVSYDIKNSNQTQIELPAVYNGGAEASVLASKLGPNGPYLSDFSDQTGPGKYWWGGWNTTSGGPNAPSLEFSLTALHSFVPERIEYSWFSGFYSGLWSGPEELEIWASLDGFATALLVAKHSLHFTLPWVDGDNTWSDDLTLLGPVAAGETLSFRLVAWDVAPSNVRTPSGLVNLFDNDNNLAVKFQAVPEGNAAIAALLIGAGAMVGRFIRRRRAQ